MSNKPNIVPCFEPEVIAAGARKWGGTSDKVATTSLKELVTPEGVTITSRYGKAYEFDEMAGMVSKLPKQCSGMIESMFCDSKIGNSFAVKFRVTTQEADAHVIGEMLRVLYLANDPRRFAMFYLEGEFEQIEVEVIDGDPS